MKKCENLIFTFFYCIECYYVVIYRTFKKKVCSMDKIKLSDIDLSSLQKLPFQGSQSIIYTDGSLCYKFLVGFYPNEKRKLYRKFSDMDGLKIDNVLLPKSLIIKNGDLQGYTMEYIRNSSSLTIKFSDNLFNCKELFYYVYKASKILRSVHEKGIIIQDLSFSNILVDDNGEVSFCDIDGCHYKGNDSPFISKLLNDFVYDYRGGELSFSEDVDKISMILEFYELIYDEILQNITNSYYHYLSDNIHTLRNLRRFANMLVDKNCDIRDLPYLDEVIDLSDDYEIDRVKNLNFQRRISIK